MKKKTSIKEMREQKNANTKDAFRQSEAKRQEIRKAEEARAAAEAERKAKEQRKREMEDRLHPVRKRDLSEEKKSTAKAAGLKSTFIMGEEQLLMTSFGRGNAAVLEKRIEKGIVKDLSEKPAFTVVPEADITFQIDGRVKNASTDNPLHHGPEKEVKKDDLIHARVALEKLYYGENFEDNIHIQAIYSILDIEKSLSIHINNIVYVLNNFLRNAGDDIDDLVGYIGRTDKYEKFIKNAEKGGDSKTLVDYFHKLVRARQLGYLNLQVTPEQTQPAKTGKKKEVKKDPNAIQLSEPEFFYILQAFSEMRNMLAHGHPKQNVYKLDGFGKGQAISNILDKLYRDRVQELNNNFLDHAGKNLTILFKAFSVLDATEKEEYVRDYYDFTVRKNYKNMGFSIKLLREHMTEEIEEAWVLRDKDYDSVRGKLYPFVDFAIYRYYRGKKEEAESLVNSLRASFSEKEKDGIYSFEAQRIWTKPQVGDLILQHILPEMNGSVISTLKPDKDISKEMLDGVLVTSEATDFSKMIYLVTLFINGKEINDLLTTLIHQFENIAAFTTVMKNQNLRTEFAKDFQLFNQSEKVARELRTINSFARMSKESAKAKEAMYIEAFKVLGMRTASEEQMEQEARMILDPQMSPAGTQRRGVLNFIANNVIKSVRFKYLIRYGNVNKLKGLAGSKAVVSFVLNDVPEDQILRYYEAITGSRNVQPNEARKLLAERLTNFSFEDIRDVRQNDKNLNDVEQQDKRQKQSLVRLYLTVLYLALKNLVYINSRYFLAFHCVERDRLLLDQEKWTYFENERKSNKEIRRDPNYGYGVFAKEFIEKYPPKRRVKTYLEQNFANSDEWAIGAFRDKVEHLDGIRNADLYIKDVKEIHSWFELYHYIMQRRIMDQFAYESGKYGNVVLQPKTEEYFKKVRTYGNYCKDFVKALNVPFAYNLPRYKNLSIDELFDKNRPGPKGSGKLDSEETETLDK